ncbi:MAG: hypothetical protein ACWGHO_05550 [Candidatus Moraniibacteriota bacterium]
MELDACEIVKLPPIFRYYKNPFDCTYYCDAESKEALRIYVKCDVAMAQWLYLFELMRKEDGCFTLKAFISGDADADVAEVKKEEVIHFLIKKVITKTFIGPSWAENHPQQKEDYLSDKRKLKKILKEYAEKFIG